MLLPLMQGIPEIASTAYAHPAAMAVGVQIVAASEVACIHESRVNHLKVWPGVCEPDDFRYSCMRSGRKHLAKPEQSYKGLSV